jgi:hypothetical protein
MSWKTSRLINNNIYATKINKVLFIQPNDITYDYDDTLDLNFSKYKQDGSFDINDGIISASANLKIMIEINIFYTYDNTDFAPRYELDIYKNNDPIITHYCGINDNVDTINNLYLTSIIDISNNDNIKIVISKNTQENSVSKINILKNSFITYKTF